MTLAGLGQCALIVRARLRLAEAPRTLQLRRLPYTDLGRFLADQVRLCGAPIATLAGEMIPDAEGRWRLDLMVGAVDREGGGRPEWLAGLGFASEEAPTAVGFWDHVDRRTKRLLATRHTKRPHPSLAMVLPEATAARLLADVMASPEEGAGIGRIEVLPMLRERFLAPLHRLPDAPVSFTVRFQRPRPRVPPTIARCSTRTAAWSRGCVQPAASSTHRTRRSGRPRSGATTTARSGRASRPRRRGSIRTGC